MQQCASKQKTMSDSNRATDYDNVRIVTIVEGSCGDVGGIYSHEYHYESDSGQDILLRCPNCGHCSSETLLIETKRATEGTEITCSACSAATMHSIHGIEVGHTFLLGTKYSAPLGAVYRNSAGTTQSLVMGCYGLGLTRLLQAAVQRCSGSLSSIVWPWAIAPYRLCIIGPKRGSKESAASVWTESLARSLQQQVSCLRDEVIVDDRDTLTIGARVVAALRTGYPLVVVVSKPALNDKPLFEFIDNTAAFRGLTGAFESLPAAGSGPVNKGGVLMTQLQLISCLEKLCDELQSIRS
ncbi:Aminoacyl-tRNA synthetase class II (G/ P/ S/T) [Trinorchestia longiramus]|nr:Aminoacyl-tRNA synthetase class II (G/ P/ S/T) [Trinorchestia longiramus]